MMFRYVCISLLLMCSTPLVWAQQINANFSAKPKDLNCSSEFIFNNQTSGNFQSSTWHFGDGVILSDTGQSISHQFSTPGSYDVVLVVVDGDGIVSKDTQNVVVTNVGISVETVSTTPSNCAGDCSAMLVAEVSNGVPPYTHSWSDGTFDSVATGLCLGNHSYTVTDAKGCQHIKHISINEPKPVLINYEATVSSCHIPDGSISAKVEGGKAPYNFEWSNNAGGSSDSSLSNLGAGVYHLTVTDKNGCPETVQIPITEDSLMIKLLTQPDGCGGESGIVKAQVRGGNVPYSYYWSTHNTRPERITNLPAGNYSLTVTDSEGCRGMAQITVEDICVGVPTIGNENISLQIYPNPSTGNITIDLNKKDAVIDQIEIFDLVGKLVYQTEVLASPKGQFTLTDLPVGMNIIRILVNGSYLTRKVQVLE